IPGSFETSRYYRLTRGGHGVKLKSGRTREKDTQRGLSSRAAKAARHHREGEACAGSPAAPESLSQTRNSPARNREGEAPSEPSEAIANKIRHGDSLNLAL